MVLRSTHAARVSFSFLSKCALKSLCACKQHLRLRGMWAAQAVKTAWYSSSASPNSDSHVTQNWTRERSNDEGVRRHWLEHSREQNRSSHIARMTPFAQHWARRELSKTLCTESVQKEPNTGGTFKLAGTKQPTALRHPAI